MKYAVVPAAIVLFDRGSPDKPGETMTFARYARMIWFSDLRWERPRANLVSLVRVVELTELPEGSLMAFEDADHAILKGIVETPQENVPTQTSTGGPMLFAPLVQIQLESFSELILQATSRDPRASLLESILRPKSRDVVGPLPDREAREASEA